MNLILKKFLRVLKFGLMPFPAIPTDRLDKVLRMLKVLRFLTSKNNRYHPLSRLSPAFGPPLLQGATRFYLSNISPFPLSMPLSVLRTTFPPKKGENHDAIIVTASVLPPLPGEVP